MSSGKTSSPPVTGTDLFQSPRSPWSLLVDGVGVRWVLVSGDGGRGFIQGLDGEDRRRCVRGYVVLT